MGKGIFGISLGGRGKRDGQGDYNPPSDRNDSPKKGQKIPKGVEGHSITGRKKKS